MIVPETLEHIANIVSSMAVLNEDSLLALRQTWPDLRFTFCNDDDIPARLPAALQREKFKLYLINGNEHCLSLTDDPLYAIGVVVATVDEEV